MAAALADAQAREERRAAEAAERAAEEERAAQERERRQAERDRRVEAERRAAARRQGAAAPPDGSTDGSADGSADVAPAPRRESTVPLSVAELAATTRPSDDERAETTIALDRGVASEETRPLPRPTDGAGTDDAGQGSTGRLDAQERSDGAAADEDPVRGEAIVAGVPATAAASTDTAASSTSEAQPVTHRPAMSGAPEVTGTPEAGTPQAADTPPTAAAAPASEPLEATVAAREAPETPRRAGRWLLTSLLGAVALAVLFPLAVDALRALVAL